MAIYHTHVKTFSRSKGQSAIAAAAYRAGLRLIDQLTGKCHNYRRRRGVVHTAFLAPANAPVWARKASKLWAAAEAAESRKDACVAREFEIALPHELNDAQRIALVDELARALVDRYQFAIQASIHAPDTDSLNHHVHMLATTRRIGADGLTEKTRELDGRPSGKDEIQWVRAMVSDTINAHPQAARVDTRVDHRTLKAQADDALARGDLANALALTREPLRHINKHAKALERKGLGTVRGHANAIIAAENAARLAKTLGRFKHEGRLLPVPDGHTHQRAQEERRTQAPALVAQPQASIDKNANALPGVDNNVLDAKHEPAIAQQGPTPAQALCDEALALWKEIAPTMSRRLGTTARLMETLLERAEIYVRHHPFVLAVKELVSRLKDVKREMERPAEHLAAYRHERELTRRAKWTMDQARALASRPRRHAKWAKRRAKTDAAHKAQMDRLIDATAKITPEGEQHDKDQLLVCIVETELYSNAMIAQYPVDAELTNYVVVTRPPMPLPSSQPPSPTRPWIPRR